MLITTVSICGSVTSTMYVSMHTTDDIMKQYLRVAIPPYFDDDHANSASSCSSISASRSSSTSSLADRSSSSSILLY